MTVRVGINGFGRVGRLVFRRAFEDTEIDVRAINDLADPEVNAHLLKYDSTHGPWNRKAGVVGSVMTVEESVVLVSASRETPNWGEMGVDVVVESTGVFTKREQIEKHLLAGAKKVVLTAPAKTDKDIDLTVVMGVNETDYDPGKHHLLSNASCTTNCLAPIAKVLDEVFGIEKGMMSTVHAKTNDQRVLDLYHKDLRRARTADRSIIPTGTGAAKAIGLVLPKLAGKLKGGSLRVPVDDVSFLDLAVLLKRETSVEEVNQVLKDAAASAKFQSLAYTEEELVSIDYVGNPYSAIVDAKLTMVMGNLVKVFAWYDNEWAYSCRVADLINYIAKRGL